MSNQLPIPTASEEQRTDTGERSAAALVSFSDPVMRRRMTWLVCLISAYAGAALIANIMSIRAVSLWGWAVDAGTLTYPLTFTLRDLIHKVGGRHAARVAIVATALLNVVLFFGVWIAAKLPADMSVGPQEEFGKVLLATNRIVAASIIAQVLAELADTEVYHRYVHRFGGRLQLGRVLTSNAVSIPLDSVLFTVIAFGGVFPRATVIDIIIVNIVIKGISSMLSAPLIYAVPDIGQDQ